MLKRWNIPKRRDWSREHIVPLGGQAGGPLRLYRRAGGLKGPSRSMVVPWGGRPGGPSRLMVVVPGGGAEFRHRSPVAVRLARG